MTEEQLSALLRVKRYEQPPAEYFERLLQDVHRRQRADLLHLPLWKIAVERMQTFFGEHSMSHLSYAGAMASVLVVGMTTIGLMTVRRSDVTVIAKVTPPPAGQRILELGTSKPAFSLDVSSQTAPAGYASVASQPRYIMDARPVSYELSSF